MLPLVGEETLTSRTAFCLFTIKGMKAVFNKLGQIFTTSEGRVSSKRACGVAGWVCALWVMIHCTLEHSEAPEITEVIVIVSASLMGIGIIEPYFQSKKRTRHDHRDRHDNEYEDHQDM